MKIWQKTLLPPLVERIGLSAIGYALLQISATKDGIHNAFERQTKVLAGISAQTHAQAVGEFQTRADESYRIAA